MIKKLPDNIWFPFWVEKWIFGSMRLEFSPEERAVWVDLLALAAKDSGYVRANEETPYLMKQLAGLLIYDESFFKQTIDKFIKKGKLQIDKNGILYITKWDKYSFSSSRKRVEKHRLIKKGEETVTPVVTNVTDGVTHNITKHNKTNHNITHNTESFEKEFEDLWKNYHPDGKRNKQYAKKRFMALCRAGKLMQFKEGYYGYAQFLKDKRVNENFEQKPKYFSTLISDYEEYIGYKYKARL